MTASTLPVPVLLPSGLWMRKQLMMGIGEVFASLNVRFHAATFSEERLERFLGDSGVPGGIFYLSSPRARTLAAESGKPVVDICGLHARSPAHRVQLDNLAAGRMAGAHLGGFPVREFACVGVARHAYACLRIQGFLEEVGNADILYLDRAESVDPEWDGRWISPRGRLEWLRRRKTPFALYLTDPVEDWLEVIEDAGLRVPEDVLVLQTGGREEMGLFGGFPVSSVNLDVRGVGRLAAETLLDLMEGRDAPRERLAAAHRLAPRQSTAFVPDSEPEVALAVRHIREHLREVESVDDVVARVPLCRSLLERRFKASLGLGVGAFIRKERYLEARRLLMETDWPVERIAEQTGYRQVNRLYEAFRRETGTTPRKFRLGL